MKRVMLTACLVVSIVLSGFSQPQLVLELKRIRNQKTIYYPEGTKINLKTDVKKYKGSFDIVSDSSIVIQSDTILLRNIHNIRTKTVSDRLRGSLIFLGGTGLAVGFLFAKSELVNGADPDDEAVAEVFNLLITISGIGALAGAEMSLAGDSHASRKWEYRIVNPLPPFKLKMK